MQLALRLVGYYFTRIIYGYFGFSANVDDIINYHPITSLWSVVGGWLWLDIRKKRPYVSTTFNFYDYYNYYNFETLPPSPETNPVSINQSILFAQTKEGPLLVTVIPNLPPSCYYYYFILFSTT